MAIPFGNMRVVQASFDSRPSSISLAKGAAFRSLTGMRIGNATAIPVIALVRGVPLPIGLRHELEAIFKTDFSSVRIHIGSQPRGIGALALTSGENICFAPGQYRPAGAEGRWLLAHELAHVVQQRNKRVRNPFTSSAAVVQDPVLEIEADRWARAVSGLSRSQTNTWQTLSIQRTRAAIVGATGFILECAPPGRENGRSLTTQSAPHCGIRAPGSSRAQVIQPYLIFRDDFNARLNNSYKRAWRNFEQAVSDQAYFRYVRDSQNITLQVSVEAADRWYGETSMWIRRFGRWYDVDKHNIEVWSQAPAGAPIAIWIKIAHNLFENQIGETLAHEWNLHGRGFAKFAQYFRDRDHSSRDIRAEWRRANSPGGYLDVRRQHDELGQRQNPYMRRTIRSMISYLEGWGLPTRAYYLYQEYALDVGRH